MIIGTFLNLESRKQETRFRGHQLSFWIKASLPDFQFYEARDLDEECRYLVVFNPDKIACIHPAEYKVLLDMAYKKAGSSGQYIYSIDGHPFWLITDFKPSKFKPKQLETGIFNDVVSLLKPEKEYTVMEMDKDNLSIEDWVLDFQRTYLRDRGVILDDFRNFYMEGLPSIGQGSKISTGVTIRGNTNLGKRVTLYPNVYLENTIINDDCIILPGCVIRDSTLEAQTQVGPFAHLRNGALLEQGAKVGNFVEMKKSVLGEGSKAMHLTYIGDATVGKQVNIGAGTITCNYDGEKKNKTVIGDKVFVGSGTELVAPITVGEGSYIGAGSTINQDVPAESLAVARSKQRNIKRWAERKKKK